MALHEVLQCCSRAVFAVQSHCRSVVHFFDVVVVQVWPTGAALPEVVCCGFTGDVVKSGGVFAVAEVGSISTVEFSVGSHATWRALSLPDCLLNLCFEPCGLTQTANMNSIWHLSVQAFSMKFRPGSSKRTFARGAPQFSLC